ncbi:MULTISPECIES: S9 family peptidase [unclassified Duganella]|uniref:alpha/beta hydrolase family protein n=1 Tax=unclassified Duganella TaxID=2636909 RepID=UPI00088A87DE|nr:MULTISPECIES: prolyl oligopeptidase family serine peptidase [unclassified Duganella]SDH13813.1 Dipeptidyl aminopeptidase/acylaminoacyl peptidase [Duganella sp. OV458]SDK28408.1 Dipeptidyl aminopeptidase/acylaminoacyl peptidase [Duganella sp. OV510]
MRPFFALATCALATGLAQAADISSIAIEKFFGKANITGAAIAPDGRNVLLRTRSDAGRSMLTVVNTETHQQKTVANFSNADVDMFFWQSDKRLVYYTINTDRDGVMSRPALNAVDRDGKNFKVLSFTVLQPRSFADTSYNKSDYYAAATQYGFRYRKSEAMFSPADTDGNKSLVRIDTRTRQQTDVQVPRNTYRWLVDSDGDVRIAVTRLDSKDTVHYLDGDWRELASFLPSAPEAFEPLLFAEGKLYVRARNGRNESSIYRYDLEKKALEASPMISVPGFDADGYFLLDDRKLLGFRINSDSENTVWFEPAMKAMQEEVDAVLPHTVNTISYGEHSATPYVLVDVHSDVHDHLYLLYNRETKKLLQLGAARPAIDPQQMAPMRMARFPARDGAHIPLYLTLPAGAAAKPLPTVVLLGDSQSHRTANWEWNDEVQFLVSRGYAVLQPQPRGIRGFGAAHEAAGAKQWSLSDAQKDIADAVKWAAAQGHTDPARVCIAGGGYGGHAAMTALVLDPALFKCGISWSGVITNSDADLKANQARVHDTTRITQPVLLAYGKNDRHVPFSDGRQFYEKLSATNHRVEWLEYSSSAEDWKTQHNRIDLWGHIEAFLGRNIGAAAPIRPGS